VTHHEIDGWAWRQTIVEIPHLESASVGYTAANGQLVSQVDCDRGDINTKHLHSPAGEPHRCVAASTGDLEGTTVDRE
jgi:hypothetical protein